MGAREPKAQNRCTLTPETWRDLRKWIEELQAPNCLLLSHTNFDVNCLQNELGKEEYSECVAADKLIFGNSVWLAKFVRGEKKNNNLDDLMKELGVEIKGLRHTALPDATCLCEVVMKLSKRVSKDPITFLFAFYGKRWFL